MSIKIGKYTCHNREDVMNFSTDDIDFAETLQNEVKKNLLFRANYIAVLGNSDGQETKVNGIATTKLANFLTVMEKVGKCTLAHPARTLIIGQTRNGKFITVNNKVEKWFAKVFGGIEFPGTDKLSALTTTTAKFIRSMYESAEDGKVQIVHDSSVRHRNDTDLELTSQITQLDNIACGAAKIFGRENDDPEDTYSQLQTESRNILAYYNKERLAKTFKLALKTLAYKRVLGDRATYIIGSTKDGKTKLFKKGIHSFFARLGGTSFDRFGPGHTTLRELFESFVTTAAAVTFEQDNIDDCTELDLETRGAMDLLEHQAPPLQGRVSHHPTTEENPLVFQIKELRKSLQFKIAQSQEPDDPTYHQDVDLDLHRTDSDEDDFL